MMDSPTDISDLPPPAYELSQKEFDDKLQDAVSRSLTITPRPRQAQQQLPQAQVPSVEVTPPPTAGIQGPDTVGSQAPANVGGAEQDEGFEEWDEEIFQANELRMRALSLGEDGIPNGNGKEPAIERSITPTPVKATSPPANSEKERPSWYDEAGLSSTSPSASASSSQPTSPSPTNSWAPNPAKAPRRAPSGARALTATRSSRNVRILPSIPQGSLPPSGATSPVSDRGEPGDGIPPVHNGKQREVVGQEAGKGKEEPKQEKERPSWYHEAGLDKPVAATSTAGGSYFPPQDDLPPPHEDAPPPHELATADQNAPAPPKQEKERPSWYSEAGLDKPAGASGSGPPPAPAPAPPTPQPVLPDPPKEKQEKERPSWYFEAGLGDSSASSSAPTPTRSDTITTVSSTSATSPSAGPPPLQWPSSATTSPSGTLPPLGELGEDDAYDEDAPPAFTPMAPPLPGPGIPSSLPPAHGTGRGRQVRPPPSIGAYVSGAEHARAQVGANTRSLTIPPQSAPSTQQGFDHAEISSPNRYSMPPLSRAGGAPPFPGDGGNPPPPAIPARVGIQSTGQRHAFAPHGYSRRLQFNPSVAYGEEGQVGTVGAMGVSVGQQSLYGNPYALYNSSVSAFLPKAMPVHANLPTPAQAYAAQHTSPPSSSTDNARLSPVSMRRAPSTSPNSGQGGDPPSIDHVGSPAPTYASNNSSSPLPSPPTQGSRPYDIALAESVIPVSESVKQMHQQFQQQSQSQSLKRYSMAPSIAPSVASGPPPPVPAYPLGMQSYNPLNAYNPPATPAPPPIQQQQQYSPSVPGYPQQGLAHSQSLYSLPTGPPRGHVPPAPGQMYPQPGYPQGQAQPWGQQGEQGGQQPVSGWQQQGTYRR